MITVPMTVAVSQVTIPVSMAVSGMQIPVSVSAKYEAVEGEVYQGPYGVTPRLGDQSLETNGLVMRDDVTVYRIPISRVSNPYDGITVLIG